ncbi:MAG: type II secretion system F family protein [Rhodospirillales bacterium]|nr:type II secretion system F family protein [Rhodospirillales bacterium]MCW8861545.1 type II secretion system F family protein [Rhodospirillales bacterium]MCW8951514.1 type II secretion system F family protein [Rhodospirillales bacterium]MCW8970705.1 type II secretion system F family protein [Rhodospirillales bacterium]MCW9002795.1 type II secretion system F family protein [Rhodospirillales bacterium]
MTFNDLLPPGMSAEDALTILVGLAAFVSVFAVWNGLIARDPMGGRIKSIVRQQEALRAGMLAPRRRKERSDGALTAMRQVVNKLNLLRSAQADKMTLRLAQAGWRNKDAMVVYLFTKLVMPFVFGGLAVFVLFVMKSYDFSTGMRALISLGAVVIGAYAPEIFISNARSKRQLALQRGLPDALDLLVICAEAGLSVDAALKRVSSELSRSVPEISDELGLCAVELGFLPDRKEALANLNARTDMASIRGVVNTLLQTEKYGTPLAQSLRVLAAEFREERMLKAEEKAAKLPATLTVPMIIFILPALFVVLLGPAIIQVLDTTANMN